MRRLMRLAAAEATSGSILGGGLLLTAIAILMGSSIDTSRLLHGWSDSFNVVLDGILFTAPVAVGLAALRAAALHRSGLLSMADTAPSGRSRSLALSAAVISVWGIVALIALAAIVLWGTVPAVPIVISEVLLAALPVMVLITASITGTVVGSRYPYGGAAPVLAVATFMWLYGWSLTSGRSAILGLTFTSTFYQPYLEPNAALLSVQLCGLSALSSLSASRILADLPRYIATTGAIVLAVVATIGFVIVDPAPTRFRPPPSDPTCGERGGITLCVWPQSAKAIEPGLSALTRVRDAAEPTLPVPAEFRQPGIETPNEDAREYLFSSAPITEGDLLLSAIRASVPPTQCQDAAGQAAYVELVDWLTVRVMGGSMLGYTRTVRRVSQQPEMQQRRWVRERVATLGSCVS